MGMACPGLRPIETEAKAGRQNGSDPWRFGVTLQVKEVELVPHEVDMEEELDEAAQELRDAMRERFRPEDLLQYSVQGGDAEFSQALGGCTLQLLLLLAFRVLRTHPSSGITCGDIGGGECMYLEEGGRSHL
jgi:hypothetical protein